MEVKIVDQELVGRILQLRRRPGWGNIESLHCTEHNSTASIRIERTEAPNTASLEVERINLYLVGCCQPFIDAVLYQFKV